jgi:hypothetical protein
VPFTCLSMTRDHLAVPHEIGHYVFWHARLPETGEYLHHALRQRAFDALKPFVTLQAPEFPMWCYHWLEELVADVYGCLVAGPVMALNFQDLALHNSCAYFTTSDDDHPVPILRPDIYVKVLQKAATDRNHWAGWAEALNQRWQPRRASCGGRSYFHIDDGRTIALADAISLGANAADDKPVDKLILTALEVFAGIQSDWVGEGNTPLHTQRSRLNTDGLYDSLRANLPNLLATATQDLDPAAETANQWLAAARRLVTEPGGNFVRVEEWKPQLVANGWTTEGPESRWP